jgi:hypothetical protein
VRLKTFSLVAGLILASTVALIGTTVAYAFEIFDYQSSILHPDYLYPLLIPLFVMTFASFFFLTRPETVSNDNPDHKENKAEADNDAEHSPD